MIGVSRGAVDSQRRRIGPSHKCKYRVEYRGVRWVARTGVGAG